MGGVGGKGGTGRRAEVESTLHTYFIALVGQAYQSSPDSTSRGVGVGGGDGTDDGGGTYPPSSDHPALSVVGSWQCPRHFPRSFSPQT